MLVPSHDPQSGIDIGGVDPVDEWATSAVEVLEGLADDLCRARRDGRPSPLRVARALLDVASLAEQVSGELAAESYRRGATWTEVGRAFGISRQAAQQRYGDWGTSLSKR